MNQSISSNISNKTSLLKILPGIFFSYLCVQAAIKYQFIALVTAILLLIISWFILRQRARGELPKTQLYFLFFPFIFLYVTGIPRIGPLPLSPLFFFIGLYLLAGLLDPSVILSAFKHSAGKVFLLMVLCWFYQYFITVTFKGMGFINMQLLEIIAIFIGMKYFVKECPVRAIWATRVLAGILVISMAWFIGELLFSEAPYLVRFGIYRSSVARIGLDAVRDVMAIPNGLSSFLFLFGYQVAVSVPLNLMLFAVEKQMSWKILWAIGGTLSLLAMIFAGERSALLAVSIVLLIFSYKKKQFKVVALIVFMALFSTIISSQVGIGQSIFIRLQNEKKQAEAIGRIKLQFTGLKVAFNNPLGLSLMDKSWSEEVFSSGGNFSMWKGEEIGVHNGYLGRIIYYGWILGILIAIVMSKLLKAIRLVFSFDKHKVEGVQYAQIAALSLLSVLIQALFHNSSIFNFNAVSMAIMFLFLTWFDLLKVKHSSALTFSQKAK